MRRIWAGALLCLLSMSCTSDRDARYLLYTIERTDPNGDWMAGGGGCMAIRFEGPQSAVGTATQDYSISLKTTEAGAEFRVVVGGHLIEHRVFDQAFLSSEHKETITFELPIGEHRYHFSSGSSCDEARPDAG